MSEESTEPYRLREDSKGDSEKPEQLAEPNYLHADSKGNSECTEVRVAPEVAVNAGSDLKDKHEVNPAAGFTFKTGPSTRTSWSRNVGSVVVDNDQKLLKIAIEESEMSIGRVIYDRIQPGMLFKFAPELKYRLVDDRMILLPSSDAIDEDVVAKVLNAMLDCMKRNQAMSFASPPDLFEPPMEVIKIHCVLELFGMKREANAVMDILWDLAGEKALSFQEVYWIWDTFGLPHTRNHAYAPPSAHEYVQVVAYHVLKFGVEEKLNFWIRDFFLSQEKQPNFFLDVVKERQAKYGIQKGMMLVVQVPHAPSTRKEQSGREETHQQADQNSSFDRAEEGSEVQNKFPKGGASYNYQASKSSKSGLDKQGGNLQQHSKTHRGMHAACGEEMNSSHIMNEDDALGASLANGGLSSMAPSKAHLGNNGVFSYGATPPTSNLFGGKDTPNGSMNISQISLTPQKQQDRQFFHSFNSGTTTNSANASTNCAADDFSRPQQQQQQSPGGATFQALGSSPFSIASQLPRDSMSAFNTSGFQQPELGANINPNLFRGASSVRAPTSFTGLPPSQNSTENAHNSLNTTNVGFGSEQQQSSNTKPPQSSFGSFKGTTGPSGAANHFNAAVNFSGGQYNHSDLGAFTFQAPEQGQASSQFSSSTGRRMIKPRSNRGRRDRR